jgi:hypothetical protein
LVVTVGCPTRYERQLPLLDPYLERVFRWMDEGESLDMKWRIRCLSWMVAVLRSLGVIGPFKYCGGKDAPPNKEKAESRPFSISAGS